MRRWLTGLGCALVVWAGWSWLHDRPVARAAGVLAPDAPAQAKLDGSPEAIAYHDTVLHPLAEFSLTARVLSREDYSFDAEADISPTDLALGWGRMSDSTVLRDIRISQARRFYHWQVKAFPIPRREIETHSANMHMIPANPLVARELKRVREGDIVTLSGFLVEAGKADGQRWRSSLTREDTGDGACELVYVQDLAIGAR